MFKDFSRRLLDSTGGTGDTTTTTTTTAPVKAWHDGKADADTLGYWQNRGLSLDDPGTVALEMTKAAREAQRFVGAPPERLVRLPEKADDEAGWNAVYQRLGAPKDAKEYDFSTVKHADGNAPDAALLDAVRATAAALRAPKDRAPELANAVVKYLDGVKSEQVAVAIAKLAEEKAALAKSWGPNANVNMAAAVQGANRLGISKESLDALEKVAGYAAVMEAMRKVGVGTSEETFVDGGKSGGNPPTTEAAQARLNELLADPAWGRRLLEKDAAAVREFNSLSAQIAA